MNLICSEWWKMMIPEGRKGQVAFPSGQNWPAPHMACNVYAWGN